MAHVAKSLQSQNRFSAGMPSLKQLLSMYAFDGLKQISMFDSSVSVVLNPGGNK